MHHRPLAALAALLLLGACATAPASQVGPDTAPSRGLVSAADPRAAEAGAQILRQGGNATDAAIATMLALTVVEPQSSGIGGGGFYVRATQSGEVETIDGRETAPGAAFPEWFLDAGGNPLPYPEAIRSGLSIGVPGNIALAAEAHERNGRLAWAELFEPAIALARDGFAMTERLRSFLARSRDRAALTPEGRAMFYTEAGEPLAAGARITNPALATALEAIATRGPEAFYGEANARSLATAVAAATPHEQAMTPADITGYSAAWRDPVCGQYRQYRICGMGPPSSGATTVFAILKQLERFDLAALGSDAATSWHLFAESQRLAYADRELYLGDADFISVPLAGLMEEDYLARRSALIAADRRMDQVLAGTPRGASLALAAGAETPEGGTSHFVAVDDAGEVVSYTSTIESSFGSGHMHDGFYLNNELTDFSMIPEVDGRPVANRVEGGKRPRSSMSPTIVLGPEGAPVLALGAAGGTTIPVQVAKALIGVLDWGLSAQEAIALPGLLAYTDTVLVEAGSPLERHITALEALGHRVEARQMGFKANGAQWTGTEWTGAADPRSEGTFVTQ